jgi:hypothetical protein
VNTNAHSIQKTTPAGVITTFAGGALGGSGAYGNGVGTQVLFNSPTGIAIDSAGTLYVADLNNQRIRRVTSSGVASVLAGSGVQGNSDGIGVLATFNNPNKITINTTGTTLYVTDNYSVRKIVISTGEVTTVAGSATSGSADGVGASASFAGLNSIAVTSNEVVYVSENLSGGRVRQLTAKSESTYASTTLTGGTLSTEFDPRTATGTIIVPASRTNAKVVSFSLPARYPSLSSITGEWILGLYATVGLPASPASFYFEIMDGSTVVVTGSTGTLVNLSSPLQLYTASLFVPTRTYSSSVILNLYVTTQASSSLTLQFSGSTLSYLSTTIQPYNDILTANEYRFKTANGILVNSNGLTAITANPTPILQVDGSASVIGNLTVGGTLNCGAITAPTSTNTINSLVINAGTCTGVDFIATSDQRTKTDIQTISNALDIVKGLRGVYFTRIGQMKQTVGVIAQEVETVLPEVVHTDSEGLKSVSYGNMVGVLIEALKDVSERLEKMENKE